MLSSETCATNGFGFHGEKFFFIRLKIECKQNLGRGEFDIWPITWPFYFVHQEKNITVKLARLMANQTFRKKLSLFKTFVLHMSNEHIKVGNLSTAE